MCVTVCWCTCVLSRCLTLQWWQACVSPYCVNVCVPIYVDIYVYIPTYWLQYTHFNINAYTYNIRIYGYIHTYTKPAPYVYVATRTYIKELPLHFQTQIARVCTCMHVPLAFQSTSLDSSHPRTQTLLASYRFNHTLNLLVHELTHCRHKHTHCRHCIKSHSLNRHLVHLHTRLRHAVHTKRVICTNTQDAFLLPSSFFVFALCCVCSSCIETWLCMTCHVCDLWCVCRVWLPLFSPRAWLAMCMTFDVCAVFDFRSIPLFSVSSFFLLYSPSLYPFLSVRSMWRLASRKCSSRAISQSMSYNQAYHYVATFQRNACNTAQGTSMPERRILPHIARNRRACHTLRSDSYLKPTPVPFTLTVFSGAFVVDRG